ncbi:hypothetical protein BGZ49_009997 [Haplosporangium sp. Z 27]|nr:hypothetical protein BGZ49_009997 [Haplosporangium sp. Z 27]
MGIMRDTTADTAVAIQDFLICLEMVFASLGHWYAFSHKDYTELDIHSARMPIYYAVRDASGIKDIIQDSLETLKGTRFTYRTFEPSEGVATVGMSRSGRIMAGLRYTGGGTSKYWLPDANKIGRDALRDNNNGSSVSAVGISRPEYQRNPNSYSQQVLGSSYNERAPSLFFHDLDEQDDEDDIEELYDASKQLEFGDYNFPAIDVFDPHRSKESDRRKMEKKNKKKARQNGETSALLGSSSLLVTGGGDEVRPLMSESNAPVGSAFGKSGWSSTPAQGSKTSTTSKSHHGDKESRKSREAALRDGCIDNVNGYVPEGKKKKHNKGSYPPAAPVVASSSSSTQQNNYNSAYDTYGYGYQSYQQPNDSAHYLGQQQQQPANDEEHRGPMFFFM